MATLCLSGPAIIKAGAGVGAVPGTSWDVWIEEAEGYLRAVTKCDVVTNWPTISGPALILSEYCCRSAAIQGVAYDMSGYTSRVEAEDIINVHAWRMMEIIKLLNNSDIQSYMGV